MRSRRSFELVLDTTLELLAEKGYQGFSLTEVSRCSKVSVGAVDETVARVGKAGYFDLRDRFTALLLERRGEIHHPDPERAVGSCLVTVYAALARAMALDVAEEAGAAAVTCPRPPGPARRTGRTSSSATGPARLAAGEVTDDKSVSLMGELRHHGRR
ncbi:hypothetical protein GCM10010385_54900 [Streptomyces geysiriensis]|nr:hypothetical protein GCM10010385_54900 [Streptomyces geysiriensis]